jgi:uncharacterized surface protein with fasciclin (FAS1) repeats
MKKGLVGLSVLLLLCPLALAQDDSGDTNGDPTVNVEALEVFSGSISDYLQSRSASELVEGGLCYDQTAELVAPEASDDTTTDDSSTEDGSDDGSTEGTTDDGSTDDETSDDATATELADTNATYTCLVQVLTATGLADTLGAEGTYTLFAPTDDAFRRLAESMTDSEFQTLLGDTEQLTQVLNYHVLPEENSLSSLYAGSALGSSPISVTTLQGSDLTLTFEDEAGSDTVAEDGSTTSDSNTISTQTFVRIGSNAASTAEQEGDAFAVQETVDADNGFVIGIDSVLMPEMDAQ